ncbi:hypothetical protein KI387_003358, partial [Taxus chinensis]
TYPKKIKRFVQYIKSISFTPIALTPYSKGLLPNPPAPPSQNMFSLSTSKTEKVDPCYISLLVGEYVLNNFIIDYNTSDKVMPMKVSKDLKLTMNPPSGSCYSLESKYVPIIGISKTH